MQEVDSGNKQDRFAKFEEKFAVVQNNHGTYKKKFEEFKAMTTVSLADINQKTPFSQLEKEWQAGLEMHMPVSEPG